MSVYECLSVCLNRIITGSIIYCTCIILELKQLVLIEWGFDNSLEFLSAYLRESKKSHRINKIYSPVLAVNVSGVLQFGHAPKNVLNDWVVVGRALSHWNKHSWWYGRGHLGFSQMCSGKASFRRYSQQIPHSMLKSSRWVDAGDGNLTSLLRLLELWGWFVYWGDKGIRVIKMIRKIRDWPTPPLRWPRERKGGIYPLEFVWWKYTRGVSWLLLLVLCKVVPEAEGVVVVVRRYSKSWKSSIALTNNYMRVIRKNRVLERPLKISMRHFGLRPDSEVSVQVVS